MKHYKTILKKEILEINQLYQEYKIIKNLKQKLKILFKI